MSHQSNDEAPAAPSFWRDPRKRQWIFQILVLALVGVLFAYIFHNTLYNLQKRGISTGFEFLDHEAGFNVLMSLIPYDATDTYGRTFLVGLLNTLLVSAIGIVFATIFGFVIGVARLSSNWIISRLATLYIEVFRNLPLLLQILFWYFAILPLFPHPRQSIEFFNSIFLNTRGLYLPAPVPEPGFGWVLVALAVAAVASILIKRWASRRQEKTGMPFPVFWTSLGLFVFLPWLAYGIAGFPLSWEFPELKGFNFRGGISVIPELFALALALSIYTAAYIAEIVRSGIQSVSHGQTEAAYALGLKRGQTLRLVIIPQAMRVIIPQLTSQYLNLTKNSSLAPAIGYPDLVAVFAGTTLNQTGQAVEIIGMTMGVYLLISLTISAFMNWYNRRMALVER